MTWKITQKIFLKVILMCLTKWMQLQKSVGLNGRKVNFEFAKNSLSESWTHHRKEFAWRIFERLWSASSRFRYWPASCYFPWRCLCHGMPRTRTTWLRRVRDFQPCSSPTGSRLTARRSSRLSGFFGWFAIRPLPENWLHISRRLPAVPGAGGQPSFGCVSAGDKST